MSVRGRKVLKWLPAEIFFAFYLFTMSLARPIESVFKYGHRIHSAYDLSYTGRIPTQMGVWYGLCMNNPKLRATATCTRASTQMNG